MAKLSADVRYSLASTTYLTSAINRLSAGFSRNDWQTARDARGGGAGCGEARSDDRECGPHVRY